MSAHSRFEPLIRKRFGNRYRKGRSKNGLEYKVCCPFCTRHGLKPDRKYKLWINPDKGVYRCWRCSVSGQASELLGDIARLSENPFQPARPSPLGQTEVMPGMVVNLAELDSDHQAYRYMRKRGFNPAAIGEFYGVSYCYEGRVFGKGSFRFNTFNTIIFPIWMHGKAVGWQARLLYNPADLTDEECEAMGFGVDEDNEFCRPPKYFTSPGMEKGRVLYNYDVAAKSDIVVITEGPTDVLSAGPMTVGTLGKGISDEQTRLIKSTWDAVIILLDPGDAAQEAYNLYRALSITIPATVVVTLSGYDDPGDAPTSAIWRQIDVVARAKGITLDNYNWGPYWSDYVLKKEIT